MRIFRNISVALLLMMPTLLFAEAAGIAAGKFKAIGIISSNMTTARAQVRKDCKNANKGINCAWAVTSSNKFLVVVECPVRVGNKTELIRWGSYSPKSVDTARNAAQKKLKTRVSGNGFTALLDNCTDIIVYDGNDFLNFRK